MIAYKIKSVKPRSYPCLATFASGELFLYLTENSGIYLNNNTKDGVDVQIAIPITDHTVSILPPGTTITLEQE